MTPRESAPPSSCPRHTLRCNVKTWHTRWTPTSWQTEGLPTCGPTTTQQWDDMLPYDVEQAVVHSIDLQLWELRHGSRWQVWPDGVPQPWQCALKRLMHSPAAAPVVVRELWHAKGEPFGQDPEGLVSALPLGGSAVLHAVGAAVHLLRAAAVTFASHVPAVRVPAATAVKWRRQVETGVRTLLVMTAGEGRRWEDRAEYAEVPVPVDGDSSDEGLPADDHSELDGSAGDASSDGGWSSDGDQGREATDEDPTTFVLWVATLNVHGYQRKQTEVLATTPRHKVDVLALTESRSPPRAEWRVRTTTYGNRGRTEQRGKPFSSTREARSRRSPGA